MSKTPDPDEFFKNSALYREFLLEREEILKHKWLESEKIGHDIGYEKALLEWIMQYRSGWKNLRQHQASSSSSSARGAENS